MFIGERNVGFTIVLERSHGDYHIVLGQCLDDMTYVTWLAWLNEHEESRYGTGHYHEHDQIAALQDYIARR